MKIAPSILSADFSHLHDDVQTVIDAGADYLHIDMMDGHFVPNISFGPMVMKAIRDQFTIPFDVHLMIQHPEKYIQAVADAGADIITIHAEATPHLHRALQQIQATGKKVGVVMNPATSVESIRPVLSMVDLVLVMTVNPGFGGQTFIEAMMDKVRYLAQIRQTMAYSYDIEVDGGINPYTAKKAYQAGADILVAGSYIFNHADYSQAIQALKEGGADV